jgi:transcriptional regulator with XRE-family HTH domain
MNRACTPVGSRHVRTLEDGLMATEKAGFGEWLAAIMKEKRLTRAEVAEAVGVDPTTVSRWITKNHQPQYAVTEPLAAVLGRPHSEVLDKTGYGAQAGSVRQINVDNDPLVVELGRMLALASKLSEAEKARLRLVIDAGIAPYRAKMNTKRRAV